MSISVVFVIKNALTQGYCFWESLSSCIPFADEIIISEGFSTDDTLYYMADFKRRMRKKVPVTIYQERWPETSFHGEAIAILSNNALKKAKSDWIYYLQADEVIHEQSVSHIKHIATLEDFHSASFFFNHFIRGWEPSTEGYKEAIRMIRNHRDIRLMGDAWNFEGEIDPIYPAGHTPKPISHFAWCFPKQNDVKDIEHAKLYQNMPEYQEKMKKACGQLNENKIPYPRTEFDDFPKISRRFVGAAEYHPPHKV